VHRDAAGEAGHGTAKHALDERPRPRGAPAQTRRRPRVSHPLQSCRCAARGAPRFSGGLECVMTALARTHALFARASRIVTPSASASSYAWMPRKRALPMTRTTLAGLRANRVSTRVVARAVAGALNMFFLSGKRKRSKSVVYVTEHPFSSVQYARRQRSARSDQGARGAPDQARWSTSSRRTRASASASSAAVELVLRRAVLMAGTLATRRNQDVWGRGGVGTVSN
jgi:hypothetical protein